jgi:hypothetical protein
LAEHDAAVIEKARETFSSIEDCLAGAIERGQGQQAISAIAAPRDLARMVLAVTRGIEALGKAGLSDDVLRGIAETTIATLIQDKSRG